MSVPKSKAAQHLETGTSLAEAHTSQLDRRTFLKLTGIAGGGFALAFTLAPRSVLARMPDDLKERMVGNADKTAKTFNAYVQISTEGPVYVHSVSPEIGQGIKTAFPMIVAEELDADWSDIHSVQSSASEELYGFQEAGGSTSVRNHWDVYRQSAAAAKAMLVAAAAETWDVPAAELSTSSSHVEHKASSRRGHYSEFAERAAELPVPDLETLALKDRKDYKLLGTRIGGVDTQHRT